jgi:hypothetical protein
LELLAELGQCESSTELPVCLIGDGEVTGVETDTAATAGSSAYGSSDHSCEGSENSDDDSGSGTSTSGDASTLTEGTARYVCSVLLVILHQAATVSAK